MRALFAIILVALLLGVGVVAVIETDPGYVLVSHGNYTLETSLWVGLLLLGLLILSVYVFLRLVYRITSGQRSLFSWLGSRKEKNALRLTTRGLISFTEGNWSNARRELLRGAQNNKEPLANYLLAARASDQLHDNDKIHEYLSAASQANSNADVAVQITLAEMKLRSGEYEQALAALDQADTKGGRYPYVLTLLYQIYQGLKDWDKLVELLPALKKHHKSDPQGFQQLEREVYQNQLQHGASDLQALQAAWQKMPKHLQRDSQMVEDYVHGLIALGDHEAAEKAILRALKHQWSAGLVRQYGLVQGTDIPRQLARAESWLAAHPEEPQLLLCLGRLSAKGNLLGKARDYFESSYRLQRSAEICAELGRLLTAQDEPKVAAAYFREGLLLTENALPDLPMPQSTVVEDETRVGT